MPAAATVSSSEVRYRTYERADEILIVYLGADDHV